MKRSPHSGSPLRHPTPLHAHTGYWLRCASNQLSHALSRGLQDKGVTLAEWVVLRELYDGDRRPCALAEKLGLTRSAISKLAERLVAKLLISQQTSGRNGRAQMLALTDTGRATVPVLAMIANRTDEEFFGDLDQDTRALIVFTLRGIVHRRGLRAVPMD